MDHAWYGPVTPGGILSDADDARVRDGSFELSLAAGVLTVEFDDDARKAEARELGLAYVAELSLQRGRALAWSPHFRSTVGGATRHEATFDAAVRFGVQLGKTVTLPDGTRLVVRGDSIDRLALPCIQANENLREVQRRLAASIESPQHEHLQRAHDHLRDEVTRRTGRTTQHDQDRELATLVGQPLPWIGDIGQSLAATRHVIGVPPMVPRLTQTEVAARLRRIYLAAVKAWCP